MKRFILFVVLPLLALLIGAKFYYEHQMKSNLDALADSLRPFGQLSYRDVAVTVTGEAQISKVAFRPNGFRDSVTIERIALRTGDLLGLFTLSNEVRQERLPEHLGISFIGMRTLTGGDLYRAGEDADKVNIQALGCGDRQSFSGHDLMDMGYRELNMNIDLDYNIINDGEKIILSARTYAQDMAELKFHMDIQLGATSRSANVMAMTFPRAELNGVSSDYQDLGYTSKILDFCQKQTGLSRDEYIQHHLAAWQDYWTSLNLTAGPNLLAAYQNFLQKPGQFHVALHAPDTLLLKDILDTPLNILVYRLPGSVEANNLGTRPLDLLALTEAGDSLSSAQKTLAAASTEKPPAAAQVATHAPETTDIALDSLGEHLGDQVRITLKNGKEYRGRIREIESGRIQFQRYISGGSLMMPILMDDIEEVTLAK